MTTSPVGTAGFKYVPYKPSGASTTDLWAVEVTDGEFAGLRFAYKWWEIKTNVDPISMEQKRKLLFKYDILPESSQEEPVDDGAKRRLQSLMGNVLLNILVELSRIEWPKKESSG